jgi:predicted transcriptional regulator
MSRKIELPTIATVEHVRSGMITEAEAAGTRPTVSEIARRLGLTNTTFWRHFPEIAADIAALRRSTPTPRPEPANSHTARIAALTRDNQELRANLALAIANIQRLTIDNHQLREKLEQQAKVVHIPTRRSGGPVTGH